MKHTYNVKGMTCKGCKASVEKHLSEIDGVTDVIVNLDKSEAEVTMEHHIATETLQNNLPEKYTLSEKDSADKKKTNIFSESITEDEMESSKLKQLQPLFLIFGYLVIATILLNFQERNIQKAMLDFMGLFFIVFSFFKLLDIKGFAQSFRMYDPLAKAIPGYGWVYPFIEVALGILFLMRIEITVALIATLVILGITTIGVTKSVFSKNTIQCACLGTTLKLPMTEATLIENAIMIIMALVMLFGLL